MFYYKNEIEGKICGLTMSPYSLDHVENFFQITEDEYKEYGGVISDNKSEDLQRPISDEAALNSLIDAFLA